MTEHIRVHRWTLADPRRVTELVGRLAEQRDRLAGLAREPIPAAVAGALVGCARAVGQAEAAARCAAERQSAAHAALRVLAAQQEAFERRLRRGLVIHPGLRRHLHRELGEIRARIAPLLRELEEADETLRRALETATAAVPDVRGLLEPAADRVLAEGAQAAAALHRPGTRARRAAVRAYLAGQVPLADPDPLRAFLGSHPEVAELLVDPEVDPAAPEIPEGPLRAALTADHPTSRHRVRAVADAARALPPDHLLRLALLYPSEVTWLDGVPLRPRIAASRLVLRATLTSLRRSDIALEHVAAEHLRATARRPLSLLRDGVERAVVRSEFWRRFVAVPVVAPDLVRRSLRRRIHLYLDLLSERVGDTRGGARRRELILFDDRGRGRAAEVFGAADERTRHLVVLVPGTGTGAEDFGGPGSVARNIAEHDPERATLAVVWMGTDFPAAIGSHAFLPGFARAGAEPLRDLVGGLRELFPRLRPLTVIGHSYGGAMVGAAERAGLEADQVLLLASPGAGPGVDDPGDYAPTDAFGGPRPVRRYAMTAPGDPVRWARLAAVPASWRPRWLWGRLSTAVTRAVLGADPERLAGVEVLDTGVYLDDSSGRRGQPLRGPLGHRDVTHPGTTAFGNLLAVVRGEPEKLVRSGN